MKENLVVLFSGGRTSAYMSRWIKRNWSHKYNLRFVFANTGQEDPRTLDFVHICDEEMSLNLTWIEADVQEKGVGTSYKIVNHKTAKRQNDSDNPFENMVKKFGLPNTNFPHCTRELKQTPIKKWADNEFSGDKYYIALGIRADEPNRLKQSEGQAEKFYPLAYDHPMSKADILAWWKNQHFDLQVPEHLGNCTWCWKKSERKLLTIASDYPEAFEFPRKLEEKYSMHSNFDVKIKRNMFRNEKTTADLLEMAKGNFKKFEDNKNIQQTFNMMFNKMDQEDCAEECGSVWK